MDIATAANFPCQRPFSEHLGVAELPEYRILPNFKQVVVVVEHVAVRRRTAARSCSSRRCCAPSTSSDVSA